MKTHIFNIVIYAIYIVGFAILAFAPFYRPLFRDSWAKIVLGITVAIGFCKGVVGLMWEMGVFTLGKVGSYRLHLWFHVTSGLILGFMISLILSGQFSTKHQPIQSVRDGPAA